MEYQFRMTVFFKEYEEPLLIEHRAVFEDDPERALVNFGWKRGDHAEKAGAPCLHGFDFPSRTYYIIPWEQIRSVEVTEIDENGGEILND